MGAGGTSNSWFVLWRQTGGKSTIYTNGVHARLPGLQRTDDYNLLATDIQEKTPKGVKKYYLVFKKKWKQLAGKSLSCPLLTLRLTCFVL
jgi:hypothetical protein